VVKERTVFVSPDQLGFDLASLVAKTMNDWVEMQSLGFRRPIAESCGDFIVEEMERRGIRQLKGNKAEFDERPSAEDIQECIFAALDRWLVKVESSTARTKKRWTNIADSAVRRGSISSHRGWFHSRLARCLRYAYSVY
jgi:hypothetical protein